MSWRAITEHIQTVALRLLEGGEEATHSLILSAPAWDSRWLEWRDTIFPLLENGVVAAGLGRTVGIVCFHPAWHSRSRLPCLTNPPSPVDSKSGSHVRQPRLAHSKVEILAGSYGGRGGSVREVIYKDARPACTCSASLFLEVFM
jgi:hypothetical protein